MQQGVVDGAIAANSRGRLILITQARAEVEQLQVGPGPTCPSEKWMALAGRREHKNLPQNKNLSTNSCCSSVIIDIACNLSSRFSHYYNIRNE
jgi:hypothetical protein